MAIKFILDLKILKGLSKNYNERFLKLQKTNIKINK